MDADLGPVITTPGHGHVTVTTCQVTALNKALQCNYFVSNSNRTEVRRWKMSPIGLAVLTQCWRQSDGRRESPYQ